MVLVMKLVNFDRHIWSSGLMPVLPISYSVDWRLAKRLPRYTLVIRVAQSAEVIMPHLLRHWGKA